MNRFVILLLLSFLTIGNLVFAQNTNTAEKLYSQGVTYMKTMTVASQNKAIASFQKAKVAFDSKAKKDLCDEQITACNNIIKKLKSPKPTPTPSTIPQSADTLKADTVTTVATTQVKISVNPSEILFSAKGGKYEEVSVECSNGEWKVDSCPEWISYTSSSTKILLKADKHKDKKNERAGIVTIKAGAVKAEVIVKQSKSSFIDFLKK